MKLRIMTYPAKSGAVSVCPQDHGFSVANKHYNTNQTTCQPYSSSDYSCALFVYVTMFTSPRYSYLFLRLGLAFVFLWFGAGSFINPDYRLNAWLPQQFIYILGIFEMLVGLSLLFDIFTKLFSLLAIIFLTVILVINGLTEIIVRDVGLISGLLAVLFWPENRMRF